MTKAHIRTALAVVSLWMAIGLLNGAQFYSGSRREGGPGIALHQALIWQTSTWLTWAVLTPIVVVGATRVPLRRAAAPILFHVVASLLTTAVWLLASEAFAGLNSRIVTERPFLTRYVARLVPSFQFQFNVVIYWAIVLATQAVGNHRRERERERQASELRERLAAAELHALRLQMQPHFLFNTLHAIGSLIRENEAAAALTTLEQLSRMLRMTLDSGGCHTVPFAQEVEMARLYAEIQRTRFGEHLAFEFDVSDETLDVEVPSLLLQPLVENAVRHGVSQRATAGIVIIAAQIAGNHLCVTVRDNGPGFQVPAGAGGGLGLSITRGRLTLLYGPGEHISLTNHPDGGAIVTVTLPVAGTAQ